MKAAAISDIGRVREINKDNYCIYEGEICLYMVADGMGGHKGGEVASMMAVEVIKDHILRSISSKLEDQLIKGILFEAISKANNEIYKRGKEDFQCEGMGTTVTLAVIIGAKLFVGHVGDSRAYIIRNGIINQITQDHSLVGELVRNGSITEREAMYHPQKNIITRALGTEEKAKVDIFSIDFDKEDILVLCTDGLTNYVDKYEIETSIHEEKDLLTCCKELVRLSNERGGHDNITVLIAKNISTDAEGR